MPVAKKYFLMVAGKDLSALEELVVPCGLRLGTALHMGYPVRSYPNAKKRPPRD